MEELKEGWRRVRLGDVIDFNPKETLKKNTMSKYVEMAQLQCFARNIIGYSFKEYKGGTKFRNGDTLLARITPCLENGKTAFVDILEEDEVGFGSTEYIVLRKKEGYTDENYIFYLAISDLFRQIAIKSMTGTSGRQRVQTEVLKNSEIVIPEVNIQKKIASILSLLDEKIELNRKINQNLEEICQNYFVEIFIKNSNKNCSIGQISDLGNIVSGATPSKKNQKYYTNFGIPWITPKDLSKISNKFISRGNLDITELGFKNSSVRLLPKGSVLFSSRAPIGYIAICSNDVTTNQGFKSIVPFKNIGTEFVYYFLKNNVQFLESRASGSTFKEISTTIMATTPAIIPKEDPLKVFKKICINIFEKQYIIEKETEKLIELRDYLLPKLMNGEIDVSNLKISKILNSDLSFYLIQFFHLIKIKLKQFFLAILNHEF